MAADGILGRIGIGGKSICRRSGAARGIVGCVALVATPTIINTARPARGTKIQLFKRALAHVAYPDILCLAVKTPSVRVSQTEVKNLVTIRVACRYGVIGRSGGVFTANRSILPSNTPVFCALLAPSPPPPPSPVVK
jgi:hypothetical protein